MYKAEIVHKQGLSFDVKAGKGAFTVDAEGNGVNPLEALLAALGTCVGVYVRKYSEGAKLGLDNFKVCVSAELSKDPALSFKQIDVDIDLSASPIDERRRGALLSFIKNCPVHNTLEVKPAIEFKLKC
jgi:uncharacterized OsmC-like protein